MGRRDIDELHSALLKEYELRRESVVCNYLAYTKVLEAWFAGVQSVTSSQVEIARLRLIGAKALAWPHPRMSSASATYELYKAIAKAVCEEMAKAIGCYQCGPFGTSNDPSLCDFCSADGSMAQIDTCRASAIRVDRDDYDGTWRFVYEWAYCRWAARRTTEAWQR